MTGGRRSGGSARCTAPGARPRQPRAIRARGALGSLALFLLVLAPAVAHAQTEVVEYYATDALGSIRVVFDANGVELGRADYLPFGEELSSSAGLPPERFTAQARDGEVGLDYFNARMYQPQRGRFSAPDSVAGSSLSPVFWNRYSYASGNPLKYVDPSGLTVCDASDGAKWCPSQSGPPSWIDMVFDPNQKGYHGGELDRALGRFEANAGNTFGWVIVDDAAIEALKVAFPLSVDTGWEWGGILFRDESTGRHHFAPPVTDKDPWVVQQIDRPDGQNRVPRGAELSGFYHTHPPPYGQPENSRFGRGGQSDVALANRYGVPSFVADPAGVVWKYEQGHQAPLTTRLPLPEGYAPPVIRYGRPVPPPLR